MNIFVVMEDEYTYYLCLHILGHEPFCCLKDEYTLFTFIYPFRWIQI